MSAKGDGFFVTTHQGRVKIERSVAPGQPVFSVDMTPAETDKATHVIGLALQMIGLDNVPSHITNSPWVIRFYPKQVFALERTDIAGSLPFRAHEGDDLIQAIQMGLGMALNEQTHGRGVTPIVRPDAGVADNEPF